MLSAKTKQSRPLIPLLRRFARNSDGVTAIEFSILALPFFAVVMAILETAMIFLAGNILETAVHDSTRLIRTGQAHEQSFTLSKYRAALCDKTFGLLDCSKIKIKVRAVGDFSSAGQSEPIDQTTGDWKVVEEYNHGARKSVMIAEAYYKWDTALDILGFNLANSPDGTVLLGAARVWRNEPF